MTGDPNVHLDKKALLVMCADNGVVEEGVTQTGQEVTAIVAENFLTGNTSAAIMCRQAGVDLFPVDIGMVTDTKVPDVKIRYGTANFVKEPAMTRGEAVRAILTGIQIARDKKKEGYQILCIGEMGIGNTTTSSAVASVLLGKEPEELTGRGALGLTTAVCKRRYRQSVRELKNIIRGQMTRWMYLQKWEGWTLQEWQASALVVQLSIFLSCWMDLLRMWRRFLLCTCVRL